MSATRAYLLSVNYGWSPLIHASGTLNRKSCLSVSLIDRFSNLLHWKIICKDASDSTSVFFIRPHNGWKWYYNADDARQTNASLRLKNDSKFFTGYVFKSLAKQERGAVTQSSRIYTILSLPQWSLSLKNMYSDYLIAAVYILSFCSLLMSLGSFIYWKDKLY